MRFLILLQLLHSAVNEDQPADLLLQLVQALSANQSPRRDPVDPREVGNLPRIRIHSVHLQHIDKRQCVICQDEFQVGSIVLQLPCGHVFCEDCIRKWLEEKRQCPTCRRCVENVPQPRRFDVCALEQCKRQGCLVRGAWFTCALVPLPNCSHVYHHGCALTLPGAVEGVECPVKCLLCDTVSLVTLPPTRTIVNSGGGKVDPSRKVSLKNSASLCCS